MRIVLALSLVCIFPSLVTAAESGLAVHLNIIECPATTKLSRDIVQFSRQSEVYKFSAPVQTTHSGEWAKVKIVRSLALPGRKSFSVGSVISVLPTLDGRIVHCTADFECTQFLNFAEGSSEKSPVLDTRRVVGMRGTVMLV